MKTKILVIEDNLEVRENMTEILELSNYSVVTVGNGKTGVERALSEHFDLIVCDIMMPVLDGYGVLHLLRKHEETRNIPFIFLTAKTERADLRKGMEMGADDYLTKPFDGNALLNAIEIRLKKSEDAANQVAPAVEDKHEPNNQAGKSEILQLNSADREVLDFKRKHLLYMSGQRPIALYYIIRGKVKIYKISEEGKELITKICADGDFWGYTSILEDINYRENAEVLEDSSLIMIPATEFLELMRNDPKVAQQFIHLIAKSMLEMEEDLLNLAFNSLRKKVAYGMVQQIANYMEQGEESTVINLSRKEMAESIGVATESFVRTLADFKEEKLIDIREGKIVILNELKLRNLHN